MFNRDIVMAGFHTRIGKKQDVDAMIRVIEELLAPNEINTLIIEFYGYSYECFPQYATGEVDKEDIWRLKAICEKYDIRLIPLLPCLSHQSKRWTLYKDHPEFLETPHIPEDATWPDIYLHHWCASNDGIYDYIFPMIDELIEVFQPEAFHCGLDEVFDIAEECCPRCAGKDKAALFARTVNLLHDHLKEKGVDMMMWGDRLLNCKELGMQMWEADRFGIYKAFDMVPNDIIICDWHYDLHDHGYLSTEQFIKGGFFDVPSFGHDLNQSKHFWGFCLEDLYMSRKYHWEGKLGGFLFTHWSGMNPKSAEDMIAASKGEYQGEITPWGRSGHAAVGQTVAAMAKTCKQLRKVR